MRRVFLAIRASAFVLTAVAIALGGCSSHEPPRTVLAETCMPMSGARPVELRLVSLAAGTLRVAVEQRGITTVATLASADAGTHARVDSASSPIEHFGVITFTPAVKKDEAVLLTLRSRDSPDIVGEVCVSAEHLAEDAGARLRAERAFAAAGQATQSEDWQRAFEGYRDAARDFQGMDSLRLAQSRHAMAEIVYLNLRNDEGAYVLASWAVSDFGVGADPGVLSILVALQARTLLESQRFPPDARRARVFELLRKSDTFAQHSRFGAREIPRFDILRGFMEFRTGHTSEARNFFASAARQCATLRDWGCAARSRQNIATMAEEARDYAVALQAYHEALDVLPPDVDPQLSADIWSNYGRLQAITGLFRQAEVSHRTSIHLHAMLADCDGTRMSVARLGTLLMQVGSIEAGRVHLTNAASLDCPALIALAKSPSYEGTDTLEVSAPESSGRTCTDPPAADSLSEAGKIAVFSALLGLRDTARLANDEANAQRCLAAARPYASTARTKLRLANAEGATLLERGEAVQAGAAFGRGLTIADAAHLSPTHENRSLAYIGLARSALAEHHSVSARNYAAQALVLGGARGDLGQVVDSLQLMAGSYSDEHAIDQAISILQVAVNLIEQVPIDDLDADKRATWLATQHTVFAQLTTLFASSAGDDENRAWQAFEMSERGRARSLRYALSQATDTRATSSSEPASVRYRALMSQITELARSAQSGGSTQIPLDVLAKAVERTAPAADESTRETLRKRLGSLDATVVEYAAGRDTMFAFVIDREHIRVLPLGKKQEIAEAAVGLYERVYNPESAMSDVRASARKLAALALWPVANLLTHRRVIFIPDDELHTVPFAVLPWSDATDAPFVIQRLEITVMPTTLFVTRAGDDHATYEASPRLELIGDPVFRTADWERECRSSRTAAADRTVERERATSRSGGLALPRLPGSRKEVDAIVELAHQYMPGSRVREHLGCEATPRALRAATASNPTLLHIATHGYIDAFRPRLSALALTPDADSNGAAATFGLLEILQMKIDSRLVVLSACDTSRGRLLAGEGVLGPAQAFLQAGAASVVASYWRVPDAATAPFMRTFYRHLFVEHLTAAAALRQTQLDYAQTGTSHDWAAFALFGWPDTAI